MNKKPEILKTKTSLEQSIVTSMRCAVADLEGLLPLIDEADERYIPVHSTINDLKIGIVRLSGNQRELWEELGNIPVTDDEETDDPFLFFPTGTNIHEIWYWFEESFDICVGDIMNGK